MATAASAEPAPDPSETYARYWHVWRSHDDHGRLAAWCASKKAEAPRSWAPTLHARTLAELERQMADPPRAIGLGLSGLTSHP